MDPALGVTGWITKPRGYRSWKELGGEETEAQGWRGKGRMQMHVLFVQGWAIRPGQAPLVPSSGSVPMGTLTCSR